MSNRTDSQREHNRVERQKYVGMGHWGIVPRELVKPDPQDVAARLAEIPDDCRSVTARVFGDPLFERSALSRRRVSA